MATYEFRPGRIDDNHILVSCTRHFFSLYFPVSRFFKFRWMKKKEWPLCERWQNALRSPIAWKSVFRCSRIVRVSNSYYRVVRAKTREDGNALYRTQWERVDAVERLVKSRNSHWLGLRRVPISLVHPLLVERHLNRGRTGIKFCFAKLTEPQRQRVWRMNLANSMLWQFGFHRFYSGHAHGRISHWRDSKHGAVCKPYAVRRLVQSWRLCFWDLFTIGNIISVSGW